MNRKSLTFSLTLIILLMMGCGYETQNNLNFINSHLQVEDIKVGLSEKEVIDLWGPGKYQEGFGGHLREYEDKLVELGFSNDNDNDLYGKVSYLKIKNPDYTVFLIRIGEDKTEAVKKLINYGFVIVEPNGDMLVKDEFSIALRGEHRIDYFQIFFNDKDLKDRVY